MPMFKPHFMFVCAAAMAMPTGVVAAGVGPRFIPVGAVADAPNGFTDLCRRDVAACLAPPSQPAPGALPAATDATPVSAGATVTIASFFHSAVVDARTVAPTLREPGGTRDRDPRRAMADAVNLRVNRNVIQRSDLDRFGVDERWERTGTASGSIGDCEDIALEKQVELIEAGFPVDRLFLATVFKPRAGLHTVLIARLDQGDVVLDSMNSRLLPWDKAAFIWLRIQTPGSPLTWKRLDRG